MSTSRAIALALAATLLLAGCADKNDGAWDTSDRSVTRLPTEVNLDAPRSAGDARVTAFEYPHGHFSNAQDLNNLKVYYYRTTDALDKVADYYANLPDFKGGSYSNTSASYSRTLPDGAAVTASLTALPSGGCQIILNVSR